MTTAMLTCLVQMSTDLGTGANLAVEAVVTLCNILHRELKSNPNRHPSRLELAAMFAEYQEEQYERTENNVKTSGSITRLHTYRTLFGRFLIGYLSAYLQPMHLRRFAQSFADGPKLDYAPCHITNENAEGWKLKKKKGDKAKASTGWLTYVLITSTIGVTIAYAAKSRYSLPSFKW